MIGPVAMRYFQTFYCFGLLTFALIIWFLNIYRRGQIAQYSPFTDGAITVSLDDLFLHYVQAVYATGLALVHHHVEDVEKSSRIDATKKMDIGKSKFIASPVTTADQLCQCGILHEMFRWFPSVKVNSEENVNCGNVSGIHRFMNHVKAADHIRIRGLTRSRRQIDASSIQIWIDPLDGSQEYTEGLLAYPSIMVAIYANSIPLAGIVFFPFTRELFWGVVDTGDDVAAQFGQMSDVPKSSHLFDHPSISRQIAIDGLSSDHPNGEPKTYHILISRSHNVAGALPPTAKLESLLGAKVVIEQHGGSGFKACLLFREHQQRQVVRHPRVRAATRSRNNDVYIYVHLGKIMYWDIAAINAIASAMGLWMSDLNGQRIRYSNGHVHNSIKTNFIHEGGIILADNNTAVTLIRSKLLKT